MSNRSFRNPHLYANLIDWAGVEDEKVTNFPSFESYGAPTPSNSSSARKMTVAEKMGLRDEWFIEALSAYLISPSQSPLDSYLDSDQPRLKRNAQTRSLPPKAPRGHTSTSPNPQATPHKQLHPLIISQARVGEIRTCPILVARTSGINLMGGAEEGS